MGRIPETTIHDIRSRIDIVDVVGRHVELKKAGRNFKGLCPFHDEKTPSFNVNADRQIFHCFGCQVGGDVFKFLELHDSLSFPEAVRVLGAQCGVEVPETGGSGERGLIDRLVAANQVAQALYRASLAAEEGAAARDYLKQRGLTDADAQHFGIGWAPDRWDAVAKALREAGVASEVGEKAGLLAARKGGGHYDRLRGRITFPIHDVRDRVVGFGGRILADGEPKYLNTPETPLFKKRETFYGFPGALVPIRKSERVIVCEGYFDRIALERAGLGEGLATCGTALTREHGRQLYRRTREVVVLFDEDEAGRKALESAMEVLLPEQLRVRAASLPTGMDPDDFLAAHGAEALRERVDRSKDAFEIVMSRAVERGRASPAQMADAVNHVAPLVALFPDPVERSEIAHRLAAWTGADPQAVQAVIRAAGRGRAAPEIELRAAPRRVANEDRHIRELSVLLCRHPSLCARYDRDVLAELLPEGGWKALCLALVDAVADRMLDADGAVDLFALEERLDAEAAARLREVAVDDELFRGETPPDLALDELVANFEKKRVDALQRELSRRMQEPDADVDALLAEKQRLKQQGLGLAPRAGTAPLSPEAPPA